MITQRDRGVTSIRTKETYTDLTGWRLAQWSEGNSLIRLAVCLVVAKAGL